MHAQELKSPLTHPAETVTLRLAAVITNEDFRERQEEKEDDPSVMQEKDRWIVGFGGGPAQYESRGADGGVGVGHDGGRMGGEMAARRGRIKGRGALC